MLQRVGAALSRLISPVASGSSVPTSDQEKNPDSSQQKEESEKKEAPPSVESRPSAPGKTSEPEKHHPEETAQVPHAGLTTTFLNILGRLQGAKRRAFSARTATRDYQNSSRSRKLGRGVKKGVMVDRKAE